MDTQTTITPVTKGKGFMKWAVVVAIVIVLNLFFNYAISLVYKAPTWDQYMPRTDVVEPITNKTDCLNVGGQWTNPAPAPSGTTNTISKGATAPGYCDPNYTNLQKYTAAQNTYDRTVFIILVVLGVISLVLGAVVTNIILQLSFSWGGVLSLVIASMRYWSDADNLLKVIILAVALGALIWIAVKKLAK
ncbi:MAG: hypothetical protein WCG55_00410 [bacterium]